MILESSRVACAIEDAALLDIGDGICCLEFRSKGNSITPTIKAFLLKLLDQNLLGYDGLVIGSHRKHFSAGADLRSMLDRIEGRRFDEFYESVRYYQEMTLRVKYFNKPIVAAPYGMTLGGGLELALHSHRRAAAANVHMGLVESGVGLLPGGGGSKEAALCVSALPAQGQDQELFEIYDQLLLGKVSQNAEDALRMGYMKADDEIVGEQSPLNRAKELCLSLAAAGAESKAAVSVTLPGKSVYNKLVAHAEALLEAGEIPPYHLFIGRMIALIFAGSDTDDPAQYSEEQILDIERSCFVELTKQPQTRERIDYFLRTGEKLQN